jgi:cupin 2 domain-containing protein
MKGSCEFCLFSCCQTSGSNVRIERIVSSGNVSPDGFWYDQEEDEWVLLITGTAVLAFEDNRTVELKAGDTLFIGAHEKHRIINTSSDPKCIWICVFMKC